LRDESDLVEAVRTGYHAFVSKNTLKHGYIHPAEEVGPWMLVHPGVDGLLSCAPCIGFSFPAAIS
jgi:hypothetical protein